MTVCTYPPRKAYKILRYNRREDCWETPFMDVAVEDGELKANGSAIINNGVVGRGVIHCYIHRKDALNSAWIRHYDDTEIWEVEGFNPVAWNGTEVCFKTIKFIDNPDEWEI